MAKTKNYCIPTYLETSIQFKDTVIDVQQIKDYLVKDLLTYPEIAELLSKQIGCIVGNSAIQKIVKHYKITLSDEELHARRVRNAQRQAKKLQEKYGEEITNVFQLQHIKDKACSTKIERYGDAHYINRLKMQQTCLEKYGVENYSSTVECREKVKETNLKLFGYATPAQNKQVQDKMKQTCLERYGVKNYWSSEEFKKWQQEKYFDEYPELSEDYKDSYRDRAKLAKVISKLEDKTVKGLANHFGISHASMRCLLEKRDLLDIIEIKPQNSWYETEIAEYIGKDLCIMNDRTQLAGKEIDIYIPSKKIGIEFNGTYWHSAIYKDKNFHLNKSKLAEEKGIRLIHIYEYEWLDPIQREKLKMMLDIALGRVQNKIYARNCVVRQITNAEALELNKSIHLQGHRAAQVTYGLFYQDKLVQLMSFSKTKYNKNLKTDNSWEIIRGCPGSNSLVVGGVSKLFKAFILEYSPDAVFSYCDFNKFSGSSYEAIGMKFIGYTGPDMKWLIGHDMVVNRKPRKHAELKDIAITQIYGAGSKKYLWTNREVL